MHFRINLTFDLDAFTKNPLGKYAVYYLIFLKSPKRDKKQETGIIYLLLHAIGKISLVYLRIVAYIYHLFLQKEKA
ncbi:hypothetical protein A3D78_06735 [Candidatus Gottesmanbacteria bacterium RIFCSPHIGHO2_02_FULL_39_14]|uniref:Uncharacterized protein n=1 Tax=Candidatus Gottesmanbacteria bacterium RIFCSPHIGHO2_02_FULL_39_14 TaxID=1798383 RepID=A0A1F6A2W6_9BACT|nr:MAG: hypothetical protein A3D78_06735 [Candidatus Gottesmanbacteria bacterium RIFCSPHIGHO2_02_FULL_39_14]